MTQFFRQLEQKLPKPILFGLYGALGCFLAAILLGEMLLGFTKPPAPPSKAIVLLIDSSSSMNFNEKLQEVKSAAQKFVERQDLTKNQIAVVGFGSEVHRATNLTTDKAILQSAIEDITDGGSTNMNAGITAAADYLKSTDFNRNILLFTDGQPNSPSATKNAAELLRIQGINIIAVATGDANTNYLAQVTGDIKKVIYANSGNFEQAFQEAEKIIGSLVEKELTGNYNSLYLILRIGAWTGILGLGTSLALIIGQNIYQRRPLLLTIQEGITGTGGGFVAGITAGSVGQLLYLPETSVAILQTVQIIQGIISWLIIALLISTGKLFFGGKLQLRSFLVGGLVAGILSGVSFSLGSAFFGDILGFLLGIVILSFFIPKSSNFGIVKIFILSLIVVVVSQILFSQLSIISLVEITRRIVGWTILGTLLGAGMSSFVPNLELRYALLGGGIGGSIGSVGFILASGTFNEIAGRLLGAAILGFFIGLMIILIEQLSREASLIVHWTPTEKTTFSLGKTPVIIGSSSEANIYLRRDQGYPPETARVYMEGDKIIMQYHKSMIERGMKILRQELKHNDRRKLGNVTIQIAISSVKSIN